MGEFLPRCLVVLTTVNQTWESCASQGIVRGVPWAALLLEPCGVIALAISDAYY